jgi:hypothetical protein
LSGKRRRDQFPVARVTDYILESPAKCPNRRLEILEKTLIEPV